jgi:hypothetical protein
MLYGREKYEKQDFRKKEVRLWVGSYWWWASKGTGLIKSNDFDRVQMYHL